MQNIHKRSAKYFLIAFSIIFTYYTIKIYSITYISEYKLETFFISIFYTLYYSKMTILLALLIALTISFSEGIKTYKNKILKHSLILSIFLGITVSLLSNTILPKIQKESVIRLFNLKNEKKISLNEERVKREKYLKEDYSLHSINYIKNKTDSIYKIINLRYSKIDSLKLNISNEYIDKTYNKNDILKFNLKKGKKENTGNEKKISQKIKSKIIYTEYLENRVKKSKWIIIERIYFILLSILTPFISIILASKFHNQNKISLTVISLIIYSFFAIVSTEIKEWIMNEKFIGLILSSVLLFILTILIIKYKPKKTIGNTV